MELNTVGDLTRFLEELHLPEKTLLKTESLDGEFLPFKISLIDAYSYNGVLQTDISIDPTTGKDLRKLPVLMIH